MVIRAISESTPAHWGQRGLGLCLLGLGVGLLWDYPLGRPWLTILALVLGAAQWRDPRAWLIALPVLLAVVDLGVWSGRLLLGEQDALLAILAGSAWAAGQVSGSGAHLLRHSFVPVWFLALVLLVGLVRGLFPLAALDANAWNGYLSNWNALRVAKGPLWALVFWPLLAAQLSADRTATETRLAVGCALALSAFGGLVLWERGLLIDLVTAGHDRVERGHGFLEHHAHAASAQSAQSRGRGIEQGLALQHDLAATGSKLLGQQTHHGGGHDRFARA